MSGQSFDAASDRYASSQAGPLVLNRWLTGGLLLSLALNGAQEWRAVQLETRHALETPLVVTEHVDGRVEVARYADTQYRPKEATIRFFLEHFVTTHYARFHGRIGTDYQASLAFLSPELQRREKDSETAGQDAVAFAASPYRDEEAIAVTRTILNIEDKTARVEFTRTVLTRGEPDSTPLVATIHFTIQDDVKGELLGKNPIGLFITYLTVD